ncbi:lysoplasmalogenase [Pedobacter sp. P351]|uniref:lysoplasmalogenase n=1 Tax=Pedobacter superstes TaxID=3133441 RepID=UPI0030B230F4
MFRKHNTFNIFYFIILILNVYALASDSQMLRMFAMPLIGMSLILYLLIKTKIDEIFHKLIFVGLVLSLAGDIQLLFSTGTEYYLMSSMIATLISYVLYGLAFFQDFRRKLHENRRVGNFLLLVLLISTVSFYFTAEKNLIDFKYPVIAYFFTLSLMTVVAAYRHRRVNRSSFKLILTGSFAFVISDLSIGYYNFIETEKVMMAIYLLTYLIAQYLIVMGAIERRLIRIDTD